ncbi:hypothetical protein ABZ079_04135 [Streptomyces sp. NPDC006314]|uniref:hypothetical protein n=1 Tax=Streptomyces sp. NPDC006314 TaxID=3154475 RepID=UPI0033B698B3
MTLQSAGSTSGPQQVPERPRHVDGLAANGTAPAYPFGHGLGHTDWAHESPHLDGTTAITTARPASRPPRPDRRARRGDRGPPRRAFEVWDETAKVWACVKGSYEIAAGRSIAGRGLATPINV